MNSALPTSDDDSDDDETKSTIFPLVKSQSVTTLRKIGLESPTTPSIICDCNKNCIHHIAKAGNNKKLNQIISNGVDIWSRDDNGRTALHWAASIGNKEKSINCVKLLLDKVYFSIKLDDACLEEFVNIQDYNKYTALYIAAKFENKEVCECLIKSYSDVTLKSRSGKTALEMIYKHIPEALVFMLDYAMERSGYTDEGKYELKLYIRTVIGQINNNEDEVSCKEMCTIANILYSPLNSRSKFLCHTLITIFLWIQWKKYQLIFWGIRIFKSIWLLLYFIIMIYVYRQKCPYELDPMLKSNYKFSWYKFYPVITNSTSNKLGNCEVMFVSKIISGFLITVTTLVIIFEIYQIIERIHIKIFKLKKMARIFRRLIVRMKIRRLYEFVLIFCIYTSCTAIVNSNLIFLSYESYYMIAAIGVFLSWIVLFLEIGKVPKYRIHIEMLTTILKTFVRVMLTYISILIAFAMVFVILLPGLPPNSTMPQAIFGMLIIMAGDPGHDSIFYNKDIKIISPSFELSMLFYALCIALVTIVMLNYLIGLTVCDIQNLKNDAEVWRCSTIISQIFILESFLNKLPTYFQKIIIKNIFQGSISIPQLNLNSDYCFVDIRKLPKNIQREIRNWNLKQIH